MNIFFYRYYTYLTVWTMNSVFKMTWEMGSSSSKFRKHLSNGDEYAALNQYNNSSELRKVLDPNSSYGDSHNHETALHYASKFAMKSLLR